MTIYAMLTTFNRLDKTVDCLSKLEASALQASVVLRAILVDDNSTDGTPDAVSKHFPWVKILHGNGNLFWCRGMHLAMVSIASALQPGDHVLWINDDTILHTDAIRRLLETAEWIRKSQNRAGIVVGATCDAKTGQLTYGGYTAFNRLRPFKYSAVHSMTIPLPCETMNGNVVLIPASIFADVGVIDASFEHAMGDTDYGLRATKRGHPVVVCPGFIGSCSKNSISGTFKDKNVGLRSRARLMLGRKGLPWRSWLVLTRRHGGPAWPIYFVWPYLRLVVSRPWFDSTS